MEFPKEIRDLVEKLAKEKLARERDDQAKRQARQAAARSERRKQVAQGIVYARKIFAWAEEFRRDKTGRQLIELGGHTFMNGTILFSEKVSGKGSCCLGVSRENLWYVRFGCGAHPITVSSPEALAGEIDPAILRQAWESIRSGRLWEDIIWRVKAME